MEIVYVVLALVDHSVVVRPRIERLLGRSLGWVEGTTLKDTFPVHGTETSEGASEHKRMRALVAPALSPESIRAMAPQIHAAAEDVRNHVFKTGLIFNESVQARNQAEQEISAGGGYQVVNAMDLTGKTTFVIWSTISNPTDLDECL